jgi:uncharacterized iron-regulated membrane protein
MEDVKDHAANLVGYVGIGAYLVNAQAILTVALLVSGIILNIIRIRAHKKTNKED